MNGDSRIFDFSPWYGKCDFVWVDANHDYMVNKEKVAFPDLENVLRIALARTQ